jgi:hypothetical protein
VVEQDFPAAEQAVLLVVELVLPVIETAVMPSHGEAVVVLEDITVDSTDGEAMVEPQLYLLATQFPQFLQHQPLAH